MRKSVDLVNQVSQAPADDALEAVHAVMHAFRSQQYRAAQGGPSGLTHMDGKVLGFFARHPGATQTELAAHSGRDKGQLARLIAGLKERGLLEARADEADRRSLRLSLTPAGLAMNENLRRQGRRLSEAAVAGLSVEERDQLLSLLQRVRSNLDAAS